MTRAFTHDGTGTPVDAWRTRPEWDAVPAWDPLTAFDGGPPARVVVVAAHPDDESLGAGGLVARLHAHGIPVSIVVATAGEGSHPRSPTHSRAAMAVRRRDEAVAAWAALGGDADEMTVWDVPDGELAAHESELTTRLVTLVGDGRHTLLVTPYDVDGHPDHDALGRAGQRVAHRCGAQLLHYPLWFWHHADPGSAPWGRLRRVVLTPTEREAKARAVGSHVSQVAPLSDRPGDEVLLGNAVLQHFSGPSEVYVDAGPSDDAFETLHTEHEDPWGTTTRWYERRKRRLLTAMLPRPRFTRALDLGCSTGTLTAALAWRCDAMVALDGSPRAVALAHERLASLTHVDVRVADLPHGWPDGMFDLVVMSESGYFLSPAALDSVLAKVAASLTPDGCLVVAHWRHPIVGWPLSGPAVHERVAQAPGIPPVLARYVDPDVEIVVHTQESVRPDPTA